MLSHQNLVSCMASVDYSSVKLYSEDIHISYLPLPHIFERLVIWILIGVGAEINFYGGDVLKLKDDL